MLENSIETKSKLVPTSDSTGLPSQPSQDVPFELAALAQAVNYQRWIFRSIEPYLGQRILEIGSGVGNMSQWLPVRERLVLTETDPTLYRLLLSWHQSAGSRDLGASASRVSVERFDVLQDDIAPYVAEGFDTVVSFNVLEHIEDDREALRRICQIVSASKGRSKRVITFVPAHNWAYGSMDQTFSHYRRYSKRRLRRLCREVAPQARVTMRHLNLFGLLGWIFNGQILRKKLIGMASIAAFERLCPVLSVVDDVIHRVFRLPLGQSLLVVLEWD